MTVPRMLSAARFENAFGPYLGPGHFPTSTRHRSEPTYQLSESHCARPARAGLGPPRCGLVGSFSARDFADEAGTSARLTLVPGSGGAYRRPHRRLLTMD